MKSSADVRLAFRTEASSWDLLSLSAPALSASACRLGGHATIYDVDDTSTSAYLFTVVGWAGIRADSRIPFPSTLRTYSHIWSSVPKLTTTRYNNDPTVFISALQRSPSSIGPQGLAAVGLPCQAPICLGIQKRLRVEHSLRHHPFDLRPPHMIVLDAMDPCGTVAVLPSSQAYRSHPKAKL